MATFLGMDSFLTFTAMIPLLIGLVAMIIYILLNGRRSPLLLHFVLVCMSLLILQLSLLLRIIAPEPLPLWLMISLQYLGLCLFALTLTIFGVADLMHGQITIRIIIPLSLVPAALFLLISTNPLHHLFLESFTSRDQVPGPAFVIVGSVIFAYLFAGFLICGMGMIRLLSNRKALAIILSASLMAPALIYQAEVVGLISWPIAVVPQLFTAVIIVYSLAAMHFHFLDITPLARRIIMNEIDIALAITRLDDRVIDTNLAFVRLFEHHGPIAHLAQIGHVCPELQVGLSDVLPIRREVLLETATGPALFDWSVQTIANHSGRPVGRMHQLTELESERQLRLILAGQNEQLETANQSLQKHVEIATELRSMTVRNRLAREMHDSLGHLLIILIAQLERLNSEDQVSRENHEGDADRISRQDELKQAAILLQKVLEQLPERLPERLPEQELFQTSLESPQTPADVLQAISYEQDRTASSTDSDDLTARLKNMSDELRRSGLHVEIQLRGPIENIPVDHNDDLMQICREAVTNAVKHGQATTINIFIMASQTQYELIILDNGAGQPEFEKGFGLINMEKRVIALGGTLRLQSDSSGFGVYAAIPWRLRSDDDAGQTKPVGSDL